MKARTSETWQWPEKPCEVEKCRVVENKMKYHGPG